MDEIGFARLLEEPQPGVPVFLGAQRRRDVAEQQFLAGLTDEIFQRRRSFDRRAKMPQAGRAGEFLAQLSTKAASTLSTAALSPFSAAVMQKAKIASSTDILHVGTFQLLFRQHRRDPVIRRSGEAGPLRRDEGGDFQPPHEIGDEGIGIDIHDRQIERFLRFFSSAKSVTYPA